MLNNTEVKTLKAHLALNVTNVSESIEFYKKMLGIEPSKVRAGYAKFDAQNPPLINIRLRNAARCRISAFKSPRPKTFWQFASSGSNEACRHATKWTRIAVTRFKTKPGFTTRTVMNGKFSS
jgi:hypothetical protein